MCIPPASIRSRCSYRNYTTSPMRGYAPSMASPLPSWLWQPAYSKPKSGQPCRSKSGKRGRMPCSPCNTTLQTTLESALLPDMPELADWTLEFDTSGIGVLQEDELKRVTSWSTRLSGGWATVAEAREADGLVVEPFHDVFLWGANQIQCQIARHC